MRDTKLVILKNTGSSENYLETIKGGSISPLNTR